MKNPNAVALGRLGGQKGGPARMAKLSAKQRRELARKAARARWDKPRWKWTTPEEAEQDEIDHWRNVSVEERVLAVEVIREAAHAVYGGTGEVPSLARVYRVSPALQG